MVLCAVKLLCPALPAYLAARRRLPTLRASPWFCFNFLFNLFCRPRPWPPRSTPRTSCNPPRTCPSASPTARLVHLYLCSAYCAWAAPSGLCTHNLVYFRTCFPQPFLYGLDDPKRTRLNAQLFNGRKICGVFTPGQCLWVSVAPGLLPCLCTTATIGALRVNIRAWLILWRAGPGGEEVPAVWVDRTGMKVGITEQYSRQSKGTLALVAQVGRGIMSKQNGQETG